MPFVLDSLDLSFTINSVGLVALYYMILLWWWLFLFDLYVYCWVCLKLLCLPFMLCGFGVNLLGGLFGCDFHCLLVVILGCLVACLASAVLVGFGYVVLCCVLVVVCGWVLAGCVYTGGLRGW